jgi:hypothetical protein
VLAKNIPDRRWPAPFATNSGQRGLPYSLLEQNLETVSAALQFCTGRVHLLAIRTGASRTVLRYCPPIDRF